MNTREQFIQALAKNEDDNDLRLVFSDWLEEQGESEEAERQRNFKAAKQWLMECVEGRRRHDRERFEKYRGQYPYGYETYEEYDSGEYHIDYDKLLELGREAAKEKFEYGLGCGSDEDMCDYLRENNDKFWECWSTVTGIPFPKDKHIGFHCGC